MNNNQLSFLDILTILSFCVGLYALEIAFQNLDENRIQSRDSADILYQLENHLRGQDGVLSEQTEVYLKQINDKLDKLNGKEK